MLHFRIAITNFKDREITPFMVVKDIDLENLIITTEEGLTYNLIYMLRDTDVIRESFEKALSLSESEDIYLSIGYIEAGWEILSSIKLTKKVTDEYGEERMADVDPYKIIGKVTYDKSKLAS